MKYKGQEYAHFKVSRPLDTQDARDYAVKLGESFNIGYSIAKTSAEKALLETQGFVQAQLSEFQQSDIVDESGTDPLAFLAQDGIDGFGWITTTLAIMSLAL